MRRVIGTLLVLLGVLASGLPTMHPAAAAEPTLVITGPSTVRIDGGDQLLSAQVYDAPCCGEASYTWDFDGDGAYGEPGEATSSLAAWDPLKWGPADLPGTVTVGVRATFGDQILTDALDITVVPVSSSDFVVGLISSFQIYTGDLLGLILTLQNPPTGSALTYAWDLDDDGLFDDSAEGFAYFTRSVPGTHRVRVRVRHDQMAADDPPATATTTIKVLPISVGSVSVTGTSRVGQRLTATSAVTPSYAIRTFQWLRDGTAINGATGATYLLTNADAGRRIAVRAGAGQPGSAPATPVVSTARAIPAVNRTRPTFTGTNRVGRRLTGAKGTWAQLGHTFTYRWLRDGRPITGATRATYVTTRADRGHRVSFRVTARRSGFPSVTATSASRRIY